MKNTQLAKRIICTVLIVVFAVIIFCTGTIMVNKSIGTSYSDCSKTDKAMFAAMETAIVGSDLSSSYVQTTVRFDRPVILVQKGGIRGSAYLFNMPITEHEGGIFNMNMGMYAQEILLETKTIPSPYRLALFTPGLGSLVFGGADTVKTVKLCGEDVLVIPYDDASLADGSFMQLFTENAVEVIMPEIPESDDTADGTEGDDTPAIDPDEEVSTDEDEEFGDAETAEDPDAED